MTGREAGGEDAQGTLAALSAPPLTLGVLGDRPFRNFAVRHTACVSALSSETSGSPKEEAFSSPASLLLRSDSHHLSAEIHVNGADCRP